MSNVIDLPRPVKQRLEEAVGLVRPATAKQALEKLNCLISEGVDEAWAYAGNLYEAGGVGVDRDYSKAMHCYEQSIRRVGSVGAYLGLIRIYYYGLGVSPDYKKAFEFCLILSEHENNMHANFLIGKMYLDGIGVRKDIDEARRYFRRSWKAGYIFGLTYLGISEQKSSHWLRGAMYRLAAGVMAFFIALRSDRDQRISRI